MLPCVVRLYVPNVSGTTSILGNVYLQTHRPRGSAVHEISRTELDKCVATRTRRWSALWLMPTKWLGSVLSGRPAMMLTEQDSACRLQSTSPHDSLRRSRVTRITTSSANRSDRCLMRCLYTISGYQHQHGLSTASKNRHIQRQLRVNERGCRAWSDSSHQACIQHRTEAHALSKPLQKAHSLLRVCLSFLYATTSRSVQSIAITASINDRRGQDCCNLQSYSTLHTKPRKVPILYRRSFARSRSSMGSPRPTAARGVLATAFRTTWSLSTWRKNIFSASPFRHTPAISRLARRPRHPLLRRSEHRISKGGVVCVGYDKSSRREIAALTGSGQGADQGDIYYLIGSAQAHPTKRDSTWFGTGSPEKPRTELLWGGPDSVCERGAQIHPSTRPPRRRARHRHRCCRCRRRRRRRRRCLTGRSRSLVNAALLPPSLPFGLPVPLTAPPHGPACCISSFLRCYQTSGWLPVAAAPAAGRQRPGAAGLAAGGSLFTNTASVIPLSLSPPHLLALFPPPPCGRGHPV